MFGLSWLSPTLLGAVGIAIIAASGGVFAAHKYDGIALAEAKAETASVNAAYSQYKASVAASVAKANADALAQQNAASAQINALQTQLLDQQKAADAKTKYLQALLAAAKPGEIRPLGPVASAYYAGLRQSSTPSPAPSP